MSKKHNPRRANVATLSCRSYEIDTNSEDEDIWDTVLTRVMEKSKKVKNKRKNKSSPIARRLVISQKQKPKWEVSKLSCHVDSDSEKLNDVSLSTIKRSVESKVNNFFNFTELLSDDEVETTKIDIKLPSKECKAFYTLSDSDDENKPTTSETPIENQGNDNTTLQKTEEGSKDELIDLVDEILDCDVPLEVNSEQDLSWGAYKNKTEEILGSVSALLDDLKRDNEKPDKSITENLSQEKIKPCPICLENFGESVTAAATICGHIFCQKCISHVATTTKKCPTCRKGINLKKVHPVYL